MRRCLVMVIGLPMLAAGAVLLWLAFGPQQSENRTTGGMLFTQQEIAAQSGSMMLGAVTDAEMGGVAAIPMEVDVSGAAMQDLALLESLEMADAPAAVPSDASLMSASILTNDVLLADDTAVVVAPLMAAMEAVPLPGQGGMAPGAPGYEQRVVELEWPAEFTVDRAGLVRIKLKMLEGGALQPVAEVGSNEVLATPILISDRYADYDALVTATISAPDFAVSSSSPITQTMLPGGDVEWRWMLEADDAQDAVITLGLTLTWQARTPGALPGPTNIPIWGQALQVKVNYVFGLITVPQASVVGTALAILGLIAQFPLLEKMLEILIDIVFGRRKQSDDARARRR